MNEKVSRTAERSWKFLTGESLKETLKEARAKIVSQAAEAPTRQEQIAPLEYAKHIWEEQLEGDRFHWCPFIKFFGECRCLNSRLCNGDLRNIFVLH